MAAQESRLTKAQLTKAQLSKAERRDLSQTALLDAAAELIAERGVEGASLASIAREPTGAGSKFILDGYRRADRAGSCNVASEFDQIRMSHDPVRNVDGEAIGLIACTSLGHEEQIPGSVVG